jgi:hypothetical protein
MPGARILRTEFRRAIKHRFTLPLTSASRLKLILSVLEAPLKPGPVGLGERAGGVGGVGGGLDLEALQSSGRVQDVFLMHDDDEAEVGPEHAPRPQHDPDTPPPLTLSPTLTLT